MAKKVTLPFWVSNDRRTHLRRTDDKFHYMSSPLLGFVFAAASGFIIGFVFRAVFF